MYNRRYLKAKEASRKEKGEGRNKSLNSYRYKFLVIYKEN
jgi:hypothetical protein